ncbi:MAG: hypothetical protein KZQ96_23660 [Candidatus Thiodiazotropha sp. (ex Lucinoma borealis)]|nr:hypothetical protein [Candidatus Thiodiazotropha sp. (ex Lucinoma borealis)]MCU7870027.1 hypothetical protein [Candidatus Thiodiazotropha sp. (ex Lucinoma borealis)]
MKKKPSWGIPHLIIGIFLTLPLIRNYEENKNGGLFYIFVALGFVILIVGVVKMFIRLFFNYNYETNSIADTDKDINYKARKTEIKNRNNPTNEMAANETLGFIFVIMSYAVLAITILGAIVMLVVASPGSISGVPIAVGIMIAGVLFLIGKTC